MHPANACCPPSPGLSSLTPREREILQWLAEGKSNWAIGVIVGCCEETVKKHLQHVYRKLGVDNRIGAINALRGPAAPVVIGY